jgi:multiple sugar transport system substrate-binding protein
MTQYKRRDFIKTTATVAAGAATGALFAPEAFAQAKWAPEKGAKLRVLRWKRFVQGDEDQWMANTKKFTEQTGVEVRIDNEGWEDVRPKAAVAANIGSGPDIVIGWFDDPHQYPDKLVEMTDVANYLGGKYGGWYDVCRKYGTRDGKWIALPATPSSTATAM